jgi:hypothetical protein
MTIAGPNRDSRMRSTACRNDDHDTHLEERERIQREGRKCARVETVRASASCEQLTICRYGMLTLKFSAIVANHTTRTLVTKKQPRLPWSDDRFQTPSTYASQKQFVRRHHVG